MRKRDASLVGLLLLPTSFALVAGSSCGDGGSSSTTAGLGGSAGSGGAGGAGGAGGDPALFDGGSCQNGDPCDGGICVSGVCCETSLACGDACCEGGQVCSFQQCVAPGAACTDSESCPDGHYCEYSLGEGADGGPPDAGACLGGAAELSGKCLPKPPVCPEGQPDPKPGEPLTCLHACQVKPAAVAFTPALKYAWGGQVSSPFATDVMMTPIVIQLDDDDCDGKVTARDIPEIVFTSFTGGNYGSDGLIHAISVVSGKVIEKWTAPGANPSRSLAAGNIDGVPGNEIVFCATDGSVGALSANGAPLWSSPPVGCGELSIADLDADGAPEVISNGGILDGAKGTVKAPYSATPHNFIVVSDIDADGKLDVVTGRQGFHGDGVLFVDTGLGSAGALWPAVADFDKDGHPEVVVVDNDLHTVFVWRYDAAQPGGYSVVRAPMDINKDLDPNLCPVGNWGNKHGGGPPTVADFNGDGVPDVALAGGVGYAVIDGKKLVDPAVAPNDTFLWIKQTQDCSSASTGSTVFDFDGDGKAEVVYSDERYLRIYEGPTGAVLWETCNTTGTLIENPVIADVDNDGHADIVAASNSYANGNALYQCNDGVAMSQSGVRIFGDTEGKWVRTRRVWNQHAYHVTNIEEDGTIPAKELPNYAQPGLNNFRQNKQPGSEFAAADAILSVAPVCFGDYGLAATVRNVGEAALPAGVAVGFYAGSPPGGTLLGTAATVKVLYSAESEVVGLLLPNAPADVKNGVTPVYAVADDTLIPHPAWVECRTDNNTSPPVKASCDQPQ
jgi:hypothetical protein